jgi:hypothetical protein
VSLSSLVAGSKRGVPYKKRKKKKEKGSAKQKRAAQKREKN